MVKNKKVTIVANWKMYVPSIAFGNKVIKKVLSAKEKGVDLIICPPSTMVATLSVDYKSSKISFGVQNISAFETGAHTGQVSAEMARGAGAKFAIVGHSECRHAGESNEEISEKVSKVISNKLTPIICIGEITRDDSGEYLEFLKGQIISAYSKIDASKIESTILAYEPIWAIGKGANGAMSPHEIHEVALYCARVIREMNSKSTQPKAFLYGGAVAPENAKAIIENGGVNGLLVGHESAIPDGLLGILKSVTAR